MATISKVYPLHVWWFSTLAWVCQVAERALEGLTGKNTLLAYYYSMSKEQKKELEPSPACSYLEVAFLRATDEVLKRLDVTPVFGSRSSRNSWYVHIFSAPPPVHICLLMP